MRGYQTWAMLWNRYIHGYLISVFIIGNITNSI